MASYLARRTGYTLLILAISSVVIFYALRSAPGGPSGGGVLNPLASQEIRQAYDHRMGLDQPVYTQYFIYLRHLATGDLGSSLVNGTPITELLANHARNSLVLGLTALAISYLIAIPLGVLAAVKRNTWIDQLAMGGAILGVGIPNFWLALILVYFFSLRLGLLPSAGCCDPPQLILPALVLAAEGTAVTVRMTRSSMLEHLHEDYVRALRAKGLPEWQVVIRHVLRNALIPVISLSGLRLGWLVGYALIVETIFRWPGVGYLLVDSVLRRDYPVAQFFSLLLIFFVLLANWLVERLWATRPSRWRDAFYDLSRNKLALAGAVIVVFFTLAAVVGPALAPYDYAKQVLSDNLLPPLSKGHLLGTDALGRDLLSRLLVGIRISMLVGLGTTAIAITIGTVVGMLAGYYRGWVDRVLNGLVELIWGFPLILIAVLLIGAIGPGLTGVVIAVGFVNWAGFARIVRGDVFALREKEFVAAARALGKNDIEIMVRHLLPNIVGSALVMGSYYIAIAIIAEAGLSFIGMGAQPPLPSLGQMINEGSGYILLNHWLSTIPGVVIVLLVLGLNVLGDGLRDVLDPRLKGTG